MRRAISAIGLLTLSGIILFFSIPYLLDRGLNRTVMKSPYVISEAAQKLHRDLFIIDMHSDVLITPRKLAQRSANGHTDLPRLIEGNVAIQAFTTVSRANFTLDLHQTPSDSWDVITAKTVAQMWPKATWPSLQQRTLYQAKLFNDQAASSEGLLLPIKNKRDLEALVKQKQAGKKIVGGLLGIEGLHALEGNINNIQVFYDAGFRMMAPVHFFDNKLGGSAHGLDKNGLTDFGRLVIKRMETLNISLDLSHASPSLIDDVLTVSNLPILVSHTGVQGTCNNPRNLSDKHILAIAKTGGVIGIGFFKMALCGEDLNALVKAIRYTSDIAGIDHVALGSDFDGMVTTVFDSSGFILLTDALLKDGFKEEEIRKIMGENTLRVLRNNLPD